MLIPGHEAVNLDALKEELHLAHLSSKGIGYSHGGVRKESEALSCP